MKRKINQNKSIRPKSGTNGRYETHEPAFRYMLSTEGGRKGKQAFEQMYMKDEKVAKTLTGIVDEPMDSFNVLIATRGQGKSADIQFVYGCGNNVSRLWHEKDTVVFPVFCQGIVPEAGSGKELMDSRIKTDLEQRISSVSTLMENEIPELRSLFDSTDGQKEFFKFIQNTNPKSLEDPKVPPDQEGKRTYLEKIRTAKENDFFIYAASKLKFYLSSPITSFNRVLIVVDNIEAQSEDYRNQLIYFYTKLYACLHNYPYGGVGKTAYVNLLISMDPITYKQLAENPSMKGIRSARKIYKEGQFDIRRYFRKKAESVPKELTQGRYRMWKEAFDTLDNFCEKLDGKYASMIMGLADNSIEAALKLFERILSNPYWITKDSCTDGNANEGGYVYNNITVIRAAACGPNLVYRGEDSPIPNVLFETGLDGGSNAILSLYIIAYFKPETAEYRGYGADSVEISRLKRDFSDLFGDGSQEKKDALDLRIERAVEYLGSCGVLGTTLDSGIEKQRLFITHKGAECWKMLAQDSVLLEMYREDYYLDYDPTKHAGTNTSESVEADRFRSSQDFMQAGRQQFIFVELYKLLDSLFQEEREMLRQVIKNGAGSKYGALFDCETMVEHLMSGVNRSVEFSGKAHYYEVKEQHDKLEWVVNEVKAEL